MISLKRTLSPRHSADSSTCFLSALTPKAAQLWSIPLSLYKSRVPFRGIVCILEWCCLGAPRRTVSGIGHGEQRRQNLRRTGNDLQSVRGQCF